jgi:phosphoglycerate dehydrogenase-like enzyme
MTDFAVAVLDDFLGVARDCADWDSLGVDVRFFEDHLADPDALVARLRDADAVVAMRERTPFPRDLLARLPRLQLLVTTAMGNASIDLEAAREFGITVCGTALPDAATVELAWGLLQATTRGLLQEDRAMRDGAWQTVFGRELRGSTLGLLGLGRLGAEIARIALLFGMDVVAWSPNLSAERAAEVGVGLASGLDDLFERSDVVSIHLRLGDRSRGLVRRRQLELLGPEGFLINTSRGPIVHEDDLVAALHAGTIAGAGLDVYDREPLAPDHPLRAAPRTTLSPHKGFVARDAYRAAYGDAVADIAAWRAGVPVRVLN